MTPLLLSLLCTATPDAALLERLATQAKRLETFTSQAQLQVDVVAEELDGDGAVAKSSFTSLKLKRNGEQVERTLLSHREGDKDLTEAKRSELEKPPKKGDSMRSPFLPEQQAKYRYTQLGAPEGSPQLLRLGFAPAGDKSEELSEGEALVDPESGAVLKLSMRPSKLPAGVKTLAVDAVLDAQTPAGRALSKLTIQGTAGFLFFTRRFRVVTTFSDYRGP